MSFCTRAALYWLGAVIVLGGLSGLGGCAALQSGIRNETDVAAHFLPTTRVMDSFDRLSQARIDTTDEGQLKLESDAPFGTLWVNASARHRQTRGRDLFEPSTFSSFATLWSRDLRLSALNQRIPLDAYAREQAHKTIQREVDTLHRESIRIDVYLYVDERVDDAFQYTSIHQMGARTFLQFDDSDSTHTPSRIDTDIVQYTTRNGEGVFYRRNTLTFARQTDTVENILADVEEITLHVRSISSPRAHLRFAWDIGA
ncbi:MAG: hypothetical protein R6U20_10435 [Longimonas sp.]|uniref:hypothetical protein n=1 Tax=Longimonas sp. TaxID=2039626 RepID=UPI003975376E